MKKHYYAVVAFLLPLLFCQHPNSLTPTPDTDQPGCFSLTQLQGLQKSVAASVSDTNTIDLGDLHSTTNYYFLLTNSGGHCITNIHLSVSDSSFIIFPTSIDSLTVGLGTQSLVPIIKLTALHGTGAQGLGSEPLMTAGIHQVNLIVTGKTRHNTIDTNISLIADATINALIMDIDIHTTLKTIDFSKPQITVAGNRRFDNFAVVGMLGYLANDSTDSIVTIINKGNVDLKIKTEDVNNTTDSSSCSIGVNDSASIILPSSKQLMFRLDGNNTVCDPNKLQLQSNGKVYFFFER
jgi:hypothetical protein